jgi:putative membrane protein
MLVEPGKTGALKEMITMMFWYGSHLVFWQAALMWVGMIAFTSLVIWAIFSLLSSTNRKTGTDQQDRDARGILDERLARGEIDAEEYQRLRDLIGPDHQAPAAAGSGR